MNIGELAERFIRAAEIDRIDPHHVGPAPLRAQRLPYVHDWNDKINWRKEPGDKLPKGADPYAEERQAFWERLGLMPSAAELSRLNGLYDLLLLIDKDDERRALLAWARAKAGGRTFKKWCFKVEGIHPETGRKRKNRALQRISASLASNNTLHRQKREFEGLLVGPDSEHILGTMDEDAGERNGPDRWMEDGAFTSVFSGRPADFTWAAKRNERRRQQRDAKRKKAAA